MSCLSPIYTTNIECCVLQIICNGAVVREFLLSELRIIDKGDSFTIRDKVGGMDFSNAEIDITAEQLRTERCTCVSASSGGNYLKYVIQIQQPNINTEDPVATVLENTTGSEITWTRIGAGIYYGELITPPTYTNIWASHTISNTTNPNSGHTMIPIESSGSIIGYYQLNPSSAPNKIELLFFDNLLAASDIYNIIGVHFLNLPEVRWYNIVP